MEAKPALAAFGFITIIAGVLTFDEARRIAANVAKLPGLLRSGE